MKAELKAVAARLERITAELEDEFGLSGWVQIHHHYQDGFDGDGQVDEDGGVTVHKTTACTVARWAYRYADIYWYLPVAAGQSDDELTQVAIHEYVHVLLAPTAQLIPNKPGTDKLDEFVTESIGRVICRARGMDPETVR